MELYNTHAVNAPHLVFKVTSLSSPFPSPSLLSSPPLLSFSPLPSPLPSSLPSSLPSPSPLPLNSSPPAQPDPVQGDLEEWLQWECDPDVKAVLVGFDSHFSYMNLSEAKF